MSQNNRERLRQAQAAAAKQQRLTRIIGVGAAVLALVIVGVIVGVVVQQRNNTAASVAAAITPPNATSDGKAIVQNPGKAKDGAPVVELFFDYQCPVCKQFESAYGAALTSLAASGDIELHYRNMTFLDQNLNNDASTRAGIAAACADVVGKYSAYHDAIYENQPTTEGAGYTDAVLRETIPTTVGITGADLTTFQSCYDNQSTKAFVNGTNEKGQQDMLAINKQVSTPTVHVNGKDLAINTIAGVSPDQLGDLITKNA
ncbi:MAG: thioredoxin domain-containing protein [Propionicimonas sp.]|uniref:DsbA family protein n=1 Tax=Propionicimonas sp. TaxID=1955623 RepID=UPI003D13EE32